MARHARLVLIETLLARETLAWFAAAARARSGRTVDDLAPLLAASRLRATRFTPHPAIDVVEAGPA